MENMIMMPACYNVMTEEEMTYTEGGANIVQGLAAIFIPVYGWFAGVTEIRDYRKANPANWTSTGVDALDKYMNKSVSNALYGAGCAFWTIASCFTGAGLVINAIVILA